jgi:exopolysaccharide production protein ExoZ
MRHSMDQNRLAGLDVLRGIAAMAVFVFHIGTTLDGYTPTNLRALAHFLIAGVDLFFVISGFVIAYSVRHLDGVADARTFVLRRLWRIAPLLYVMTIAFLLFSSIRDREFSQALILNSVTIIPLIHTPPGEWSHALPTAWTLGFELGFYLIVAAVVASSTRWRLWGIALGTIVAGAAISSLMFEFAFGVFAYAIWSRNLLTPTRAVWIGLAGVVLFLLPLEGERFLISGIPSTLVLIGFLGFAFTFRPALWLGKISYSLYLSHLVTFEAIGAIAGHFLPLPAAAIVLVVAGLVIAWLVYEAVEAPSMRLAKRWKTRSTSARVAVGS